MAQVSMDILSIMYGVTYIADIEGVKSQHTSGNIIDSHYYHNCIAIINVPVMFSHHCNVIY